jgi:hypothetical protein
MPNHEAYFLKLKKCCYASFLRDVFQLHLLFLPPITVAVAQLVRASDCGSEGRRFEPG